MKIENEHFARFEIACITDDEVWADSDRGAPHPKARRIWGVLHGGKVRPMGWLMPQVDDSGQQPRSLAEKLLRARWAT